MLAIIFGGRASVGAMLPMLICGDIFAVAWYGRHTRWEKFRELGPWVFVVLGAGGAALWALAVHPGHKDIMGPLIGCMVLALIGIQLVRRAWPDRITPSSRTAIAVVGTAAGIRDDRVQRRRPDDEYLSHRRQADFG